MMVRSCVAHPHRYRKRGVNGGRSRRRVGLSVLGRWCVTQTIDARRADDAKNKPARSTRARVLIGSLGPRFKLNFFCAYLCPDYGLQPPTPGRILRRTGTRPLSDVERIGMHNDNHDGWSGWMNELDS